MPVIRDCFDVAVKNDEQLIKLASVVQKIITRATSDGDGTGEFSLTDEERKQLVEEVEIINKTDSELSDEVGKLATTNDENKQSDSKDT